MALRGRRFGMAVLDGLGGPSYRTSECGRVRYILPHRFADVQSDFAGACQLLHFSATNGYRSPKREF